MHRLFNKKLAITLLSLTAVFLMVPQNIQAASVTGAVAGFFGGADLAVGTITKLFFEILILPFAAAMLALMGNLMDVAINFSIHTSFIFSLSPAIDLGWKIMRDIANILFIFILIYIGIGTIVKSSSFGTKKLLTGVIIAAILINFSMFFTKIIIDVSNVFGNWLYSGITKTLVDNSKPGKPVALSGLIADRLGIAKYWISGQSKVQNEPGTAIESLRFTNMVIRLIVVLIATYVFAYCAILFMARSVELLILLIFAPIGFVGGLLPQTKKYADEWWHELGCVATFPVAFLLMLYITMQFINSLSLLQGKLTEMSPALEIGGFSVATYFQYFIVIFLLLASLKVAKENACKVGELVGGAATGLGKFAVTSAVSMGVGASAFFARGAAKGAYEGYKTGGLGGMLKGGLSGAVRKEEIMASIKNPGKIWVDTKQAAGRAIKKAATERTWDMRRAGIPFGEKIGLEGSIGDVLKKQTGIDFGMTKTNKEKRQEQAKKKKENREAEADVKFREAEESLDKIIDDFERSSKSLADTDKAIKDIGEALSRVTDKQAGEIDEDLLKNNLVVMALNPKQIDSISDPETKKSVVQARISPVKDLLEDVATGNFRPGATSDNIRDQIRKLKLSPEQIAKIKFKEYETRVSAGNFDEFIKVLRPQVLQKMIDSVDENTRNAIRNRIGVLAGNNPPVTSQSPEVSESHKWFDKNRASDFF